MRPTSPQRPSSAHARRWPSRRPSRRLLGLLPSKEGEEVHHPAADIGSRSALNNDMMSATALGSKAVAISPNAATEGWRWCRCRRPPRWLCGTPDPSSSPRPPGRRGRRQKRVALRAFESPVQEGRSEPRRSDRRPPRQPSGYLRTKSELHDHLLRQRPSLSRDALLRSCQMLTENGLRTIQISDLSVRNIGSDLRFVGAASSVEARMSSGSEDVNVRNVQTELAASTASPCR
jgi:hypothetical protein